MKGCIVGIFKLVGGIVGAAIGLMFAISLLSNEKPVSPARQLEIHCEEGSKTQPTGDEQRAFYESCIASGLSVIRAQERINREGSQSYRNPSNGSVTDSSSSSISPLPPLGTDSPTATPSTVIETQPVETLAPPTQSPSDMLPTLSTPQSSQGTADVRPTDKQPE